MLVGCEWSHCTQSSVSHHLQGILISDMHVAHRSVNGKLKMQADAETLRVWGMGLTYIDRLQESSSGSRMLFGRWTLYLHASGTPCVKNKGI